MKNYWFALLAILVIASGCGQKTEEAAVSVEKSSVEATTQSSAPVVAIDPATVGSVKGKILFEGEAPPVQELSVRGNPECAVFHQGGSIASEELMVNQGALKNVFVYVKEGLERREFPVPSTPVTIENKNCMYAPHVSGAQVNQEIILLNQDATLHNIHSYMKNSKPWNLGLPFQGMKQVKKIINPEVMVTLKCDVHPWMIGYVGVLPHPYFSVTNEAGEFEIKNLPPGDYVIEAWHEKLGAQSQTIKIEPQEVKTLEWKFSLKS